MVSLSSEFGKTCIIFASCDEDLSFPGEDLRASSELVVCADGGLRLCHEAGMRADIAVGDFDSANPETMEKAKSEGTKFYEYPAEKDETDLDLALKVAFRLGVKRCYVFGALGGRLDHELANIFMLRRYASMGMNVTLKGLRSSVEILTHVFPCRLEGRYACSLSLIPLSDTVVGISTLGMKYELHDEDLASGSSRGVSNIVGAEVAVISCVSGEAAIITSTECTMANHLT